MSFQVLGMPLTIYVSLSKLLNCSVPQFPCLENEDINSSFFPAYNEN